jgi:hypothetical protein
MASCSANNIRREGFFVKQEIHARWAVGPAEAFMQTANRTEWYRTVIVVKNSRE